MDLSRILEHMRRHAESIRLLARGMTKDQARWRPAPDKWSVLEVINHLADEERLDFRTRLDYILHRPGEAWLPIDPQGWVTERKYNERALDASLADFLTERDRSLEWLGDLATRGAGPDWQVTAVTRFGEMKAGDMLASWAAHDVLHLRQLVRLRWALLGRDLDGFDVRYAGEW